jgi:hypothetical protein
MKTFLVKMRVDERLYDDVVAMGRRVETLEFAIEQADEVADPEVFRVSRREVLEGEATVVEAGARTGVVHRLRDWRPAPPPALSPPQAPEPAPEPAPAPEPERRFKKPRKPPTRKGKDPYGWTLAYMNEVYAMMLEHPDRVYTTGELKARLTFPNNINHALKPMLSQKVIRKVAHGKYKLLARPVKVLQAAEDQH